jgi:peptidoglycan/xylan/chitin deacetylase (PgdA/CDA1 family)
MSGFVLALLLIFTQIEKTKKIPMPHPKQINYGTETNSRAIIFRHFLGKIRWGALEAFYRRDLNLTYSGPIVSFTFDDFPQSALHIGGSILKNYGLCGTYYVAMGLMDQANGLGRQFSAADLKILLRDGHELGSHTFDHFSCRSSSYQNFQANAIKGMKAVDCLSDGGLPKQFSYPKGHVAFWLKQRIGERFTSCRGIIPGINESPVDLNLLRANCLYSCCFDVDAIDRLFESNERLKGWLIFYTHDISENPSPFGCKPDEFESVVKLAMKRQVAILPVGKVILGTVE